MPARGRACGRRRAHPGTAGSGICFTQTTTFMEILLLSSLGRRHAEARAPAGSRDSAKVGTRTSKRGCPAVDGPLVTRGGTVVPVEAVDLVVAGAGPAGTAAALTGAQPDCMSSVSTGPVPARQDLRRRPHDPGALRLLEQLGLTRRRARSRRIPARRARCVVVSPSGRRVTLPLPTDGDHAGVVAARRPRCRARRAARPAPASTCAKARRSRSSSVARTTGSRCGCDERHHDRGPARHRRRRSLVDRAAAARTPTHRATSARGTRSGSTSTASTTNACGCCSSETCCPGYAWVFPMPGGGANVGYGVLRDGRTGRELKELWPTLRDAARAARDPRPRATPAATVRARGRSRPRTRRRASPTGRCCTRATPRASSIR